MHAPGRSPPVDRVSRLPCSRYVARRLLFAVPTLLAISFIVFALLDLAPNDPTAQLPPTIPPETRQAIKESLGFGQPFHVRYLKWLHQFMVNEPLNLLEHVSGIEIGGPTARRAPHLSAAAPHPKIARHGLPHVLTWRIGWR